MRIPTFILCVLVFTGSLCGAQSNDFVASDGITSELHKANAGRITFMEKTVPIESYKAFDFLSTVTLKEGDDFSMRAFLGNSLTNYLHSLAPALTVEELNKAGNYRFSFYVDSKLIYEENINPGAGLPAAKNKSTVLRIPFISSTQEDSWGRYLWGRFMARGGDDALTTGEHSLRVVISTYVNQDTVIVGPQVAEGTVNVIVLRKGRELSDAEAQPQQIAANSGWEIDKSPYNKQLIMELKRSIAGLRFKNITSIVVIRNGKLLLEEYFNGATRSTLHDTRSVGKSFASALTGFAIRDGYIPDENVMLSRFYTLRDFSNYSPRKDSVTLKSLLTMSSAFNGSDSDSESPGNEENMYPTDNWVKFTLDLPMDEHKSIGKKWDYFTAGVVVLGDILHRSVPGGLDEYSRKVLFTPLGIREYKWQYTPQHVANTAGGLGLRSLDLARFGQLYKNGGVWEGKRLLPAAWVEKTLSPQIDLPQGNGHYGYLFWNTAYTVNGEKHEAFYCSGNGGNKVFVFKDLPLVVIVTATAYGQAFAHPQVEKIMEGFVLPAVVEAIRH